MLEIREATGTPEDYARMAAIECAIWPDTPKSGSELAMMDQLQGEAPSHRWIGWRDGEAVATMSALQNTWDRTPGLFDVFVGVHPSLQGQGEGQALYEHGLARLTALHSVSALRCETREDQPRGIRFLTDRGFALYKTTNLSELEVTNIDSTQLERWLWPLRDQGVQVHTIDHLQRTDAAWFERFHATLMEFKADMVYPPTPLSLEEHRAEHDADPFFDPELSWAVLVDGEWAGYTSLYQSPADPTLYWTTLTGTRRKFRRRGLASLLKATAIQTVRARNGHRIRTDNDPRNPMFQINLKFNFRQIPTSLTYQLKLGM